MQESVGAGTTTRRWAPKVKTGCRTCRTRRIKCDELKPTCRRCKAAGLQCSGWGYGAASPPASRWTPKSVPLPPSNLPQLNGSSECRDLILLGPLVSARDLHPPSLRPNDAKAHFLTARSKRLASYVYHIPCRAGYSVTLDSAVACVAAVLRELSAHEDVPWTFVCSARALALYGTALHSLHAALQDPKLSVAAETLCATELLGLFESIVAKSPHEAMSHARGTSQLIRHRGPRNFTSDFEKSLLVSRVPSIAVEALLEGRTCFLGEDDWLAALSSGVSSKFTDLSEETVSVIEHVIHIANLIKACTDLVTAQETRSNAKFCMRHVSLLYRIDAARKSLLRWFDTWIKSVPTKPTDDTKRFAQTLGQGDMELYISYQCFRIMYNRIYTALNGDKGRDLEKEAQEYAKALSESPLSQYRVGGAGAVMCMVTFKATLATADEWRAFTKEEGQEGVLRIIEPGPYCRWIGMCGIPVPERYSTALSIRTQ